MTELEYWQTKRDRNRECLRRQVAAERERQSRYGPLHSQQEAMSRYGGQQALGLVTEAASGGLAQGLGVFANMGLGGAMQGIAHPEWTLTVGDIPAYGSPTRKPRRLIRRALKWPFKAAWRACHLLRLRIREARRPWRECPGTPFAMGNGDMP